MRAWCSMMMLLGLSVWGMPQAATTWTLISSDQGKRIEFDPASVKRDESGKAEAWGRMVLDRDLHDPRSGGEYRLIEALSRYDCGQRNYETLRRVYRKANGEVLREEEVGGPARPVRSGTLDARLLKEVCRPRDAASFRREAGAVIEQAASAAEDLRKANEEMIKREVKKAAIQTPAVELAHKVAPPKEVPKPAEVAERTTRMAAAPTQRSRPAAPPPKPRSKPAEHEVEAVMAKAALQHADIHWGYEGAGGPDFWGRLKPEFALCANGKRQSPIDIRDGIRVDQPAIDFSYRPSMFRIVDNGHTVQVAVGGSRISLLGKRYELVQFHFHRPAEERVDGRGFDMVAHFVHKAEDGALAVLAVLIEKGAENPFIQTLWNHLPLEKNVDLAPPEVAIDPARFLPENRGYYSYMGSLTTPPCSEGVLWLVLKQPVQASAEQVAIFSRLYRNNARPIQPVFNRLIKESR